MTPPVDENASELTKKMARKGVNVNTLILSAVAALITICTATIQHSNGEGTAEIKRLHVASSEKLDKLLERQNEMGTDIKVLQNQHKEIEALTALVNKIEDRLHTVETRK